MPFIVGVSRSGTTLLRLMLDAHPQLAIPPETHFIPELVEACDREGATPERALTVIVEHRRWPDFRLDPDELGRRLRELEPFSVGGALRAFYGYYAEQAGKPRWGDKSPPYTRRMPLIERLVPEARFIHLIRDGRDVALSLSEVHFGPSTVEDAADRWASWIVKARRHSQRVDHYLELRYEDLVADPRGTLERVCEFLDLPWDPAMLDYHRRAPDRMDEITRDFDRAGGRPSVPAEVRAHQHRHVSRPPLDDRVARWRSEMSAADRARFEVIAGDVLSDLGYPLAPAPFVVGATRSGTTLLRLMLDAHPLMAVPPETHFVLDAIAAFKHGPVEADEFIEILTSHRRWPDFALDPEAVSARLPAGQPLAAARALRAFYRAYAEQAGKLCWGDKTPGYLRKMASIERVLPEARFIHLIRDGRDVALSITGLHFGPQTVGEAAERWAKRVRKARQEGARVQHYLEVRYEDLVLDPEPTLRRVCEYLELPWEASMLDYHERAPERLEEITRDLPRSREGEVIPAAQRVGIHALASRPPQSERVARWRTAMSESDRAVFAEVAGDLLAELGYPER